MSRLPLIDPASAQNETKELFDAVKKKMGKVPNIVKALGNSPAMLKAYLGLSGSLQEGKLSPRLSEQLALAIGQLNGCDYCVAAHTMLGKMAGLSAEEILQARKMTADDPKEKIAIKFAVSIMETKGFVKDEEIEEVRKAGFSDEEIAEITGSVLLSVFTNFFNHVAEPEIDFPLAPKL